MQIPPFDYDDVEYGDWRSRVSITLGEWYELGFYKPDDARWKWDAYSDEQYERVCRRFLDRYYYREVSLWVPDQWWRAYMRKFNELMPKYALAYKRLESGLNPLAESDEYEKSRDIFSDFPATQLSGNADYTSTGTDRESETVREGNVVSQLNLFYNSYRDVDVALLDEVEPALFSGLMAVTIPKW